MQCKWRSTEVSLGRNPNDIPQILICTNIAPAKTAVTLLEALVFPDHEHNKHIRAVCAPRACTTHLIGWACRACSETLCPDSCLSNYSSWMSHQGLRALNPCIMNSSECGHKIVRYFEELACTSRLWVLPERTLQEQKYRLVALWCNPNNLYLFLQWR